LICFLSYIDAALAGVKADDRLIEINGVNVQKSDNEDVKQRIRSLKYPAKLELLVADKKTYDYYKAQNKLIHRGLPSVRHMAENMPGRPPTSVPNSRRRIYVVFFRMDVINLFFSN
jgi:hypothetical protein